MLSATGPHRFLGDEACVFDRFVGGWDCDYTHFDRDGAVIERYRGSVTFGWILEGWAVQDVWIGEPPGGEEGERSVGTTVRLFDPESRLWHCVWIAPSGGVIATVRGGAVDDRIVLEGENPDGSRRRWSFNDIRPDSFVWRGERSTDGGANWYRTAEYRMTRPATATG